VVLSVLHVHLSAHPTNYSKNISNYSLGTQVVHCAAHLDSFCNVYISSREDETQLRTNHELFVPFLAVEAVITACMEVATSWANMASISLS
jgi:hypothetical protein